jgi:hypothetical protein
MILEGSVVEAVLEEAIVLENKTATTPTYKRQKGPSGDSVSPPSAYVSLCAFVCVSTYLDVVFTWVSYFWFRIFALLRFCAICILN